MTLPEPLRTACEAVLNKSIVEVRPIGGGDINEARQIRTSSGLFFLKFKARPPGPDWYEAEAEGLSLLSKTGPLKTPKVVGLGNAGPFAYLLLEFVPSGPRNPAFWESFGEGLAALHRQVQPYFGLSFDNYIGSLPQANGKYSDFPSFYYEKRLLPQLQMAIAQRWLTNAEADKLDRLAARLPDLLPSEPPCLIHGDLWAGNFLSDQHDRAVLIDPSVAFSHRELDLGMSRLFSGFDLRFYQAYHASYPTAPGFNERLDIYQLYYLLVHVNLFGAGYVRSVRQILDRFGS